MPITSFQPAAANVARYQNMACHVFALSGNPLSIANVNTRYNQLGQNLLGQPQAPAGTLRREINNVLAELGDDQRIATLKLLRNQFGMASGNGTNIRLWGLFRNHLQMLPEHMWITKGGIIYDTMPDAPIRRNANLNGANPPSEAHQLNQNIIFSVEVAALHVEQMNIINSPNWA